MLSDNFTTNERLLSLVDNIAGGNMRLALRFVAEFIGSGHIDFLLPILLTQAQLLGEQFQEEGYVEAGALHAFCQQLGFSSDQIVSALDYSLTHRLLDPVPRYTGDQRNLHYGITTVGAYSTKVLRAYFAYVDAVLVDTPIVDEQYRRLIEDVHSLSDRVTRAEYFRLYLAVNLSPKGLRPGEEHGCA